MDIEIGDYVRTSDGIKRIIKINIGKEATYYGTYILDTKYKGSNSIARKNILNHNKDIIELVEVGDFVNGKYVFDVFEENGQKFIKVDCMRGYYYQNEIKTILTKEQYEQYAYKVEV